jgi:uncharacterized protein (DUF1015 family)
MANIIAFRGLRYNQDKAGAMPSLTAPPYDVIDEQAQSLLYAKNPYNIIRLEYGQTNPGDNDSDNRYTRAAAFFSRWQAEGVLSREPGPVLYFYEQEFFLRGQWHARRGLMAGVEVEDYASGVILPHEETLSKAKTDRLELLRAARANFSPIFGIYHDRSGAVRNIAGKIMQHTPQVDFTDDSGEKHRLWTVGDEQILTELRRLFLEQKIFIADGHHRYETANLFHREMAAKGHDRFGFVLMSLVDVHDPGLLVLPTHRLIKNVTSFDSRTFPELLARHFTVTALKLPSAGKPVTIADEMKKMQDRAAAAHIFALYTGGGHFYLLDLSHEQAAREMASRAGYKSAAWRNLDVAVLQCLVLEELLGISEEARRSGQYLSYTRDETEAQQKVDSGVYQAAFFLKAPSVSEVVDVAAAGDKMPQKSTYFYPKLLTGLVINDFSV